MAQQESWEDLPHEQTAPPSKGFPSWLWFCGCGCLLVLLTLVLSAVFAGYYFSRWVDPEHELPRLARVLPFDEPLDHLEFVVGFHIGLDAYVLQDPETDGGYILIFTHMVDPERAAEMRQQALDPGYPRLLLVDAPRREVEPFTIELQGRSLEGTRFFVPDLPPPFDQLVNASEGAALYLDLTLPGDDGLLLFQAHRADESREPIPDAYLRHVLAPFHVGPDR